MYSCYSADARQRIVSERVDMINNLVISVSVCFDQLIGRRQILSSLCYDDCYPSANFEFNNLMSPLQIGPPSSRFLTSSDKSTWNAKDVADSVLSDKSTLVFSCLINA